MPMAILTSMTALDTENISCLERSMVRRFKEAGVKVTLLEWGGGLSLELTGLEEFRKAARAVGLALKDGVISSYEFRQWVTLRGEPGFGKSTFAEAAGGAFLSLPISLPDGVEEPRRWAFSKTHEDRQVIVYDTSSDQQYNIPMPKITARETAIFIEHPRCADRARADLDITIEAFPDPAHLARWHRLTLRFPSPE